MLNNLFRIFFVVGCSFPTLLVADGSLSVFVEAQLASLVFEPALVSHLPDGAKPSQPLKIFLATMGA